MKAAAANLVAVPRLRGVLHAFSAPIFAIAGSFVVAQADSSAAKIATAVYLLTALNLFSVSATYHIGKWSTKVKQQLRNYDHSNIFVIIAGTYTPLSVTLLPASDATWLLIGIWTAALLGVLLSTIWVAKPRWLSVPIYLAMGWASIFYVPTMAEIGGDLVIRLIGAGGVLYSIGALVYALKWPNFSRKWFGFHELFHAFTVAAFACQFAAIAIAVI